MRKSLFFITSVLVVLSTLLAACATTTPAAPVATAAVATTAPAAAVATAEPIKDRVQVYWYIGLGAGAQPAQIPLEKAFVDKYNAGQGAKDGIQLITIIVDNKYATDNLTAQIAAGNVPDIVGPVGTAGRASFPGSTWLDLNPLIAQLKFDTSKLDPAYLEFFKQEGKTVGLPLTIYPSVVYFNKDLFEAAGLKTPPQKVGEKYNLDGKDVDWNFDTLAALAQKLTIDKAGKNATEAGFDSKNIVQYGFDFQWVKDNPRMYSAYFQPYYPVKDGKADISDGMRTAIKWYYNAMWGKQPFLPNQAATSSDLLNKGNTFDSGKVAMAITHLWYTCCITAASDKNVRVKNWDVAVVPVSPVDGKTHAKMHADTFAIMAATKHPEETFKVYTYMVGEGAKDLYALYGGLPVANVDQAGFFADLDKKFAPVKVTWQVFIDMIPFMDAPNHELQLPNNNKSNTDWLKLGSDLASTPNLDVDKRIDQFITDWNVDLAAATAAQ